MAEEISAWLYDILNAIVEIESFFDDKPKNFMTIRQILKQKER